jgi:anti-anti-sigma factor
LNKINGLIPLKRLKLDKITINKYNNGTEIEVKGNLNIHNIDTLLNEFKDMIAENPDLKNLGVNCEFLESIDSSGFGMLISLSRQSEKNGINFYICELNRHVSALFDISHLDKFFQIVSIKEFRKIVQG